MTTSLQTQAPAVGQLQLSPIQVTPEYLREWNESCRDFVCLSRDGELLRPTLYRVGGIGTRDIKGRPYFMLLKYVEAAYSQEFMRSVKSTSDPKHLEGRWVILNQHGEEKVEFKRFDSPYLVKDSCLYSLDRTYYNIETGECYGRTMSSVLESQEFIFLDLSYEKDVSKRGVLKINKKTGATELFPG